MRKIDTSVVYRKNYSANTGLMLVLHICLECNTSFCL